MLSWESEFWQTSSFRWKINSCADSEALTLSNGSWGGRYQLILSARKCRSWRDILLIRSGRRTGSLPGWMSAPRQRLSHGKLCRPGTQEEICSRQENRLITGTFNELGPKSGRPIRLWGNNPGGLQKLFIISLWLVFEYTIRVVWPWQTLQSPTLIRCIAALQKQTLDLHF